MADISKCFAGNCKIKEKCYRFTAKDSYHQYYTNFYKEDKECEYFIKNK